MSPGCSFSLSYIQPHAGELIRKLEEDHVKREGLAQELDRLQSDLREAESRLRMLSDGSQEMARELEVARAQREADEAEVRAGCQVM